MEEDEALERRVAALRGSSSQGGIPHRPWLCVHLPQTPKTGDPEVDFVLSQIMDDLRTDK